MLKRGSRIHRELLVVLGVIACLLLVFSFVAAHTNPTKKKNKKPTATQLAKLHADSLAAVAQADSAAKALFAQAEQDSIKRVTDSLALRAESAKAFKFRKVENKAFSVGERLEFSVNYGFITAGEAVMQVAAIDTIAGRACYRVEFTVNSLPSFSWVYKVEDRYLTYIDVDAIAPLKFEQHIREGTYRRDFIADFDQVNHIAKTTEGTYPIPEYVHDIMSAFYFARTIDFSNYKPGDGTVLHNFYKDQSHELKVNFLGRQELDLEAGTFNTLAVEPLVKEGGLFKSEGRIVIWLSDDERKIPVRVNTKVVIGSIDTELKSYSGLNGPIDARIK